MVHGPEGWRETDRIGRGRIWSSVDILEQVLGEGGLGGNDRAFVLGRWHNKHFY